MMTPADVEPRDPRVKIVGTFNPGVAMYGDRVVVVVRVVEEVVEDREGYVSSPRVDPKDGSLQIDWLAADQQDCSDPRIYVDRRTGVVRLRFISHLRVFFSRDGFNIDETGPIIEPAGAYEIFGIEDPRVTAIEDRFYMTYVAVSDRGICTCLMSTDDFQQFERHGVMLPPDNKDVVLFPEKINGQYVAMHRPMPSVRFSLPQIWLAQSHDLLQWGGHHRLLGGDVNTSDRIGGGTPPIHTDDGWLTIYHGNEKLPPDDQGNLRVRYTGGALLLDTDDPAKLIAQTTEPIIVPEAPFETQGFVDDVIFPTAVIRRDDQYLVYNGAADENISVIAYDVKALEATLQHV